jgi:hypothetical protein
MMIYSTGRGQLTIHKRTWAYLKSKLNVEAHPVDLTTFQKCTQSEMKTAGYSQLHKCEYLPAKTIRPLPITQFIQMITFQFTGLYLIVLQGIVFKRVLFHWITLEVTKNASII